MKSQILAALVALALGAAALADGITIPANTGAATFGSLTTTGDVNISEGALTDSTVVSADIKNGTVADADMSDTDAFTFGGAALTQTNGTFTGLESDSLLIGTTDDTFTLKRNDSGAVTLISADDNADAALTVAAGGTGALTLGASGNTSITLTTDGTGNGELTLPNDSIGDADLDFGTGAGQFSPADLTFAEGDITDSTIVSADIKDGEVASADIANGTVTLADVNVAGLTGIAAGTATAAAASSVDYVGAVHRSVITITNASVTMTDGSDEGHGVEVFTFPEGRILILSAAVDLVCTNGGEAMWEADTNDQYVFGVGTDDADDDATLAGDEADIIASTTIDTSSGTVVATDVEADMTAGADSVYDGTASAVKLYVNWAAPDTALDDTGTIAVVPGGTLSVVWAFLGDD